MTGEQALRPYRVPAPAVADRIAWPDSFGTRFTVFCDVEEDFDWRLPLDRASRSTAAMAAFPDGHARLAAAGVGLACMIDHPIVSDPAAVAMLTRALEDGRSAIGAQLHPWVNPPHDELVCSVNSYAGNLPEALEGAKIDVLTEAITVAFGRAPIAYRAGRYGIGPHTLALLRDRGYRIDSSMRSGYDYSGEGGPDFHAIGSNAFYREGLFELPLTTVFTGLLRSRGAALHSRAGTVPHGRGILSRLGLVNRVALTPEDMPIEEALTAVDIALSEGLRLLSLSFHSPSLAPGNTPYVRDGADLRRFWRWWDRMLERLAQRGVTYASLDDILVAADRR